jgi:hypothetical protein
MDGRVVVGLVSIFLCISCAEATAQQRTFVTGDEVRVTATSLFPGRVRGIVLGARPDTLVLELEFQKEAGAAVIPLDAVETFEVARGNSQMVGRLILPLLGIAGGAAAGNAVVPNDADQFFFVLGGILGAVAGGLIGYQMGKGFDAIVFGTRWVEVPLSRVRWETRGFHNAAPWEGRTRELSLALSLSVRL